MRNNLKWIAALWLILATILTPAAPAFAQATPKTGDTGAITGTVTQITTEFLLLQPATGTPQRLWFKWISTTSAVEDRSAQPIVANLKTGDAVEAQWSFDGQRRLESIILAPRPMPAPKTVQAQSVSEKPAPPATPSPAPPALNTQAMAESTAISTGDKVNALLDNLLVTGERLLELPLFILLGALGMITAVMAIGVEKITKKGRPRAGRVIVVSVITAAVLGGAIMIDRKLSRLQSEIRELRTRSSADTLLPAGTPAKEEILPAHAESQTPATAPSIAQQPPPTIVAKPTPVATPITTSVVTPPASPAKRTTLFFDPAQTQKALIPRFGTTTIKPTPYDSATDIISVHTTTPLVQAYLAIVDLHNPAVEIKLGFNLETKTLTSQFARNNDCTVAINGEAGASPGPRSGLGPWQGYMVQQGKLLLREYPTIPRPYLCFDPQNHADFTPLSAKDRALPAVPYNIIWGRVDALLNGTVQDIDPTNRQPRTAMGLDQDGSHLYLFVVDGRQPRYSMGFTRGEVATFLKAFGAANAMLCDEGGSSCIFLKSINGIGNIPSDDQGQERPTYTHFGIAMRKQG